MKISDDYRSPFSMCPDISVNESHWLWTYYRDEFVRTGCRIAFGFMLEKVTADNPPSAPGVPPGNGYRPGFTDLVCFLIMSGIVLIVLWAHGII